MQTLKMIVVERVIVVTALNHMVLVLVFGDGSQIFTNSNKIM